ncbi:MAG: iron(III) ABC transporter iron (III)-binding protein [Nitrospirales bacterium]|nr:MAG: iron(III) ABC transporter iron (III)-binding protein [Nitrospirales bacterium]
MTVLPAFRISQSVQMRRVIFFFVIIFVMLPAISMAADQLVVYSGRAERLIKPVLDTFQDKTGIQIQLLTGSSTQLVNRIQAEGPHTQADVFITNDAGTLERARELQLLKPMKIDGIEHIIPSAFRAPDNSWIGLSGRIWVIVYNTKMIQPDQVTSILDVADPKWKGKLAIPTANSEYLQAGVSVISAVKGDERTEAFLKGIRDNAGNFIYGKNRQIVDAVAKGKVAMGLVNHYYIYRYLAEHADAPIAPLLTDQKTGEMGMIMNATGIGVVTHSKHTAEAKKLIQFLISQPGQHMFADRNKEYPIHHEVKTDPALPPRKSFHVAQVPLAQLAKLREPTMLLIERSGLR